MDIRQLRYFLAVAEHGSFTGAAKTLLVTQPTLTLAVQKLETQLGTKLLRRSASGLQLTNAGQTLYDEGQELLERLDSLEARIMSGTQERQSVRVGITVLFSTRMMQRIGHYISTHPHVALTLVQDGSRELQRQLVDGSIDVGVLSFPRYESALTLEPLSGELAHYDIAVVMRRDHPLARRKVVTFADLQGSRFSTFSDRFVLGQMLPERTRAAGYAPDVAFANDDWEVLLSSVETLGSVCLLPAGFETLSTHVGLAWVPLDDKARRFAIGVATVQDADVSPAVAEFVAELRRGR